MANIMTIYLNDAQYDTVREIALRENTTSRIVVKKLVDKAIESVATVKPNAV